MKHTLRGSTLAETLVMMLVAGIVFLAAMEALTLVSRLAARGATRGRARRGGTAARRNLPPRAAAHNGRQRPRRSGRRHRRAAVPLSCRRRDDTDDARLRGSIRRGGVPRYAPASCRAHAAPTLRRGGRYPRNRRRGPYAQTPRAAARTGKLRTKNR